MYEKCQNYTKASFNGATPATIRQNAFPPLPTVPIPSASSLSFLSQFHHHHHQTPTTTTTPSFFPFHFQLQSSLNSNETSQFHETLAKSTTNKYNQMASYYKCPFCLTYKDLSNDFIDHLAQKHFIELKVAYEKSKEIEIGEVPIKVKHDLDETCLVEPLSKRMNTSPSSLDDNQQQHQHQLVDVCGSSSAESSTPYPTTTISSSSSASSSMHCKICHRGFEYYSNLRRHIKTKHKIFGKQIKDFVIRQKITSSSTLSPPQESNCSTPHTGEETSINTVNTITTCLPSSNTSTTSTTNNLTNHSLKNIIKTKFKNETNNLNSNIVDCKYEEQEEELKVDTCPSPISTVSNVSDEEQKSRSSITPPQQSSLFNMHNQFLTAATQQALNAKFKTSLLEALLTNRNSTEQHLMAPIIDSTNNPLQQQDLMLQRMNYLRKFFQTIAAQNGYIARQQQTMQQQQQVEAEDIRPQDDNDEEQDEEKTQQNQVDLDQQAINGENSNCSFTNSNCVNNNANQQNSGKSCQSTSSNQIRFSTEVWRCPYCCYETTSASRYNSHLVSYNLYNSFNQIKY